MQNKDVADYTSANSNNLYDRIYFLILENFIATAPDFFCIQQTIVGESRKRMLVSENHDVLQPHSCSSFSEGNWKSRQIFFIQSMKVP